MWRYNWSRILPWISDKIPTWRVVETKYMWWIQVQRVKSEVLNLVAPPEWHLTYVFPSKVTIKSLNTWHITFWMGNDFAARVIPKFNKEMQYSIKCRSLQSSSKEFLKRLNMNMKISLTIIYSPESKKYQLMFWNIFIEDAEITSKQKSKKR